MHTFVRAGELFSKARLITFFHRPRRVINSSHPPSPTPLQFFSHQRWPVVCQRDGRGSFSAGSIMTETFLLPLRGQRSVFPVARHVAERSMHR